MSYDSEGHHEIDRLRAELAALRAELEVFREREAATAQGVRWLENESKRIERRAEKAEAERDALRAAGEAALRTLDNVRVFVTSRERIHKPSGEEWFEGCVKALRDALEER